jgi:hypothetical protein
MDMSIKWRGTLSNIDAFGEPVDIDTEPRSDINEMLRIVGKNTGSLNTIEVGATNTIGRLQEPRLLRLHLLLVALFLAAQSCLALEGSSVDVDEFIQQREACDHFRGEIPEPGDVERIEEIKAEIRKFCTGTDAKLDLLRKKYSSIPVIVARLAVFETRIERKQRMPSPDAAASDEGSKK